MGRVRRRHRARQCISSIRCRFSVEVSLKAGSIALLIGLGEIMTTFAARIQRRRVDHEERRLHGIAQLDERPG